MIVAAQRNLKQLHDAKTSEAAREAWLGFLENSNRAINRLEGYAKKHGKMKEYMEVLQKDLWANDLTKYMRSARNSHEHGIEDTEVKEEYSSHIIFPGGQIFAGAIIYGKTKDGRTVVSPQTGPTEFVSNDPNVRLVNLKPSIRMMPVVSTRGETIMPPHVPGLKSEDESQVHAVARTFLDWVTAQVDVFTK